MQMKCLFTDPSRIGCANCNKYSRVCVVNTSHKRRGPRSKRTDQPPTQGRFKSRIDDFWHLPDRNDIVERFRAGSEAVYCCEVEKELHAELKCELLSRGKLILGLSSIPISGVQGYNTHKWTKVIRQYANPTRSMAEEVYAFKPTLVKL